MNKQLFCLDCDKIFDDTVARSEPQCFFCGGENVIAADPETDDWDGHFEGDMTHNKYGNDRE